MQVLRDTRIIFDDIGDILTEQHAQNKRLKKLSEEVSNNRDRPIEKRTKTIGTGKLTSRISSGPIHTIPEGSGQTVPSPRSALPKGSELNIRKESGLTNPEPRILVAESAGYEDKGQPERQMDVGDKSLAPMDIDPKVNTIADYESPLSEEESGKHFIS